MAKRGIKEPEGSENWPDLSQYGVKKCTAKRGEPGHIPCYWSNRGHLDREYNSARTKASRKYRENFDKIKWDA